MCKCVGYKRTSVDLFKEMGGRGMGGGGAKGYSDAKGYRFDCQLEL